MLELRTSQCERMGSYCSCWPAVTAICTELCLLFPLRPAKQSVSLIYTLFKVEVYGRNIMISPICLI